MPKLLHPREQRALRRRSVGHAIVALCRTRMSARNGVCDELRSNGCALGTDCADCHPTPCADTCRWARDGACDEADLCAPGTDCSDCHPVSCTNTCFFPKTPPTTGPPFLFPPPTPPPPPPIRGPPPPPFPATGHQPEPPPCLSGHRLLDAAVHGQRRAGRETRAWRNQKQRGVRHRARWDGAHLHQIPLAVFVFLGGE